MSENALAVKSMTSHALQKSKPRYTEAENEMLFESWWHPQKRRELVNRLGRKMSALRSQFCRLLKEKGLSNQEYYNLMQSRYASGSGSMPRKRSREMKEIDRVILEVFCKHQALGNARSLACDELQERLSNSLTPAALKLRFYRLIKRLEYHDDDLIRIGNRLLQGEKNIDSLLQETGAGASQPLTQAEAEPITKVTTEVTQETDISALIGTKKPQGNLENDNSFFYQLSSLPDLVGGLDKRLNQLEEKQRYQLDLRGFVEHLLSVERDLKREDRLMEEIQQLMDENEQLTTLLDKEKERLKKREEELATVHKMLDDILSEFMHLETVSKLASLGDFMHRLEITVDQFGNVLKSRRAKTS